MDPLVALAAEAPAGGGGGDAGGLCGNDLAGSAPGRDGAGIGDWITDRAGGGDGCYLFGEFVFWNGDERRKHGTRRIPRSPDRPRSGAGAGAWGGGGVDVAGEWDGW